MVLDRFAAVLADLFEINGQRSAALNALVVAVVLFAVASVGYSATVSEGTHRYTEFYLLTENDSGDLVAQDYPESIDAEESNTFHVAIENHLSERTEYSIVVKLQRIYLGNGTPEVLEEEVVTSQSVTVPRNHREIQSMNVAPEMRGSQMRLRFLLYRGEPPERPSEVNSYHETHLWLNVSVPDDGSE
jgi:uncharacterized membrane protein